MFQEAVARRAGVNGTDLQCLNLLVMNGSMTPTALSDQTGITAGGAITAVIDRLERAGLARRSRASTDRRKVLVIPDLDEAWRRLAPLYAGVQDRWTDYLRTLSDEQIDIGVQILAAAAAINRSETAVLRGLARPASTDRAR